MTEFYSGRGDALPDDLVAAPRADASGDGRGYPGRPGDCPSGNPPLQPLRAGGLKDCPRSERPHKVTRAWERLVVRTGEQDPRRAGVLRATWPSPALPEYLTEKAGKGVLP